VFVSHPLFKVLIDTTGYGISKLRTSISGQWAFRLRNKYTRCIPEPPTPPNHDKQVDYIETAASEIRLSMCREECFEMSQEM